MTRTRLHLLGVMEGHDSLNVSPGPSTPLNKTQFDAGALELNQFVTNVDVSKSFRVGGIAGPLNVAAGAEYRRENYQIHAGEPDSYKDGGVPNPASRSTILLEAIDAFRHRTTLGTAGEVRLHAGYNGTRTKVVGSIATPTQLIGFESVLVDRIEQRIECAQPHDSVRLGSMRSRTSVGVNLNLARYGEFCSFTLNPSNDQEYSPKWLTDVEASCQVAGYRLPVGAQNLFAVFSDRNSTVNSFNGIQTFPRQSPFGMNGRTVYARIGRRF